MSSSQEKHLQIVRALGALFFVAIIVALAVTALRAPQKDETAGDNVIPPYTAEVQARLQKSRGFEVLISYTNRGFEPSAVSLNAGESVRFTNNSSHDLWVASEGTAETPVYPGKSECGSSAFDTCRALKPHEFWEFTFTEVGTWLFRNNLDKEAKGTVRVEVN